MYDPRLESRREQRREVREPERQFREIRTREIAPPRKYYDEMGMRATKEQKDYFDETIGGWRETGATYQTEADKLQGNVDLLHDQWKDYDVPSSSSLLSELTASEWSKSSYVDINVWDGSSVEGTYKVDKKFADSYLSNGGVWANKIGNQYYVDVTARAGNTIGQELHDAFSSRHSAVGDEINKAYMPQVESIISQAQEQKGLAEDAYQQQLGIQDTYSNEAKRYENLETNWVASLTEEYEERSQKLREGWANFAGGIKRV